MAPTGTQADAVKGLLLARLPVADLGQLSLLYLMCFLDRTNIGNAKVAHLERSIGIDPATDTEKFPATLTIFFVSYALFEALCNFLLKKFRPSIFIPVIMILWGSCMLGMGFVKNWSGLMAGRWFLGVCEAGLFPGINYYLSCWYRRDEFGVRAAIFFSAAAISGSFGGLLAAAIQKMDGLAGLQGWAWIFIIEGMLTIIIALASFWMVHDFPDEAKFLSEDDRARVILRLKRDGQHSAEHEDFKWDYLWAAFKDWKTYAGMLIYMGPLMPLYAFSTFLPSIIQNMSFTDKEQIVKNQLLSVPPYALAALLTVVVGFWSDKCQRRGVFNMGCAAIGITGFIMLMATTKPGVQYAGTFLGACGIYPSISLTIAWVANNVEGVYKRGIVLGFVIGWGNLNGVVSSNIYRNPPRYFAGHGTVVAYLFVCMFGGSALMWVLLGRENRKRRNGERDHWIEGKTDAEINALGDKRPDFIYTL
ncbi:MFS transporter [Drechmeria coniospora]|uniref:MFS transporter n=1 Tax=Drechmeria coniospora TaxID=98403 RepID=A0A151GQ48_DRECN|nr:MFS transporter [Drechmeria coniospora]KYK59244.1 MFS transporter [Drechmeria coniospora]